MRRHGLSSDAKQAIASFIAASEAGESKPWDCGEFFEALGDFRKRFERLRQESVLIVEEVIATGGPLARLSAAGMCLMNHAQAAEFAALHPALIQTAEAIVSNALDETTDPNKIRYICTSIGLFRAVPKQAVPRLRKLLRHESEPVRVSAASALCLDDWSRPSGIIVLAGSLTSDDPGVLVAAAVSLLSQRVRQKDAVVALKKALHTVRGEAQVAIVQLLHRLGPVVKEALRPLSDVVRDRTMPDYVRGRAAAAIGSITRDDASGAQLLKKALRSKKWEIVVGAADGLAANGGFGDDEVSTLAMMLSAEDEKLRCAAAYGLKQFGPRAAAAIPAMLARIGVESNQEACQSLAAAFGALGQVAIGPLLELLQAGDMRQFPVIVASLAAIGSSAAEAIAHSLLPDSNPLIRSIGIHILWNMGGNAAPAMPMLVNLLDEATDAEAAFEIMTAIAVCGPSAQAAADAVVRALLRWDEDFAESAAQLLRVIGEPALAALKAQELSAVGEAKQRIGKAIASIGPQTSESYKRLENYQRDDLLRMFVLVGEIFDRAGETSWIEVAKMVRKAGIAITRANGTRMGTTDRSIAKAVNDLARLISGTEPNGVLTTHREHLKGTLTPAGDRLWQEARGYLEQKYGKNSPGIFPS